MVATELCWLLRQMQAKLATIDKCADVGDLPNKVVERRGMNGCRKVRRVSV
jgi:hypothetical protein